MDSDEIKEFEIRIKIRNNLLIQRREALGLNNKEIAKLMGLSLGNYNNYENLIIKPLKTNIYLRTEENPEGLSTEWKESALKIAEFYQVAPDELWPDVIFKVQNNMLLRKVGAEIVEALLGKATLYTSLPPSELYELKEKAQIVKDAVSTLPELYQIILNKRFSLDGGPTFEFKIIDAYLQQKGYRNIPLAKHLFGVAISKLRRIEKKSKREIKLLSEFGEDYR